MVNTEQAQSASSFLMLRPAAFGWNRETSTTNPFQSRPTLPAAEVSQRATLEFEAVLDALRRVGVECFDFSDRTRPACPDAVFPNNWVSLHSDGTVVLYPMLSLRRRMERRLDLLDRLRAYKVRPAPDDPPGKYETGTQNPADVVCPRT